MYIRTFDYFKKKTVKNDEFGASKKHPTSQTVIGQSWDALCDLFYDTSIIPLEYILLCQIIQPYILNTSYNDNGLIAYRHILIMPGLDRKIIRDPRSFFNIFMKGLACYIDPSNANYYSDLRYDEEYITELFGRYCDYLSNTSKLNALYRRYLYQVCALTKRYHDLRDVLLGLRCRIISIDHNPVAIDNQKHLNPCIALGSNKEIGSLLNKALKYLNPNQFFTSAPTCSSNYSFNAILKKNPCYIFLEDSDLHIQWDVNPYQGTNFMVNLDKYPEIHLSEECQKRLFYVTGGGENEFEILAKLFGLSTTNYYSNFKYTMPSKNVSPLSLYVIVSSESTMHMLNSFLAYITGYYQSSGNEIPQILNLKTLCGKKALFSLIGYNLVHTSGYTITSTDSKASDKQTDTVTRILRKKEVQLTLQSSQKLTCLNHIPVFCFVQDENALTELKKSYPTIVYQYSYTPTDLMDLILTEEDQVQLRNFLCIYGLLLLYNGNFRIKTHHPAKADNEMDSVRQFVEDCIGSDPESVLYAQDAYDVYCNYYPLVYTGTPLKRSQFVKKIQEICRCTYKKPRHSRNDNHYAFVGIKYDREKIEEFLNYQDKEHKKADKEFDGFCDDILAPALDSVNVLLRTLTADKN